MVCWVMAVSGPGRLDAVMPRNHSGRAVYRNAPITASTQRKANKLRKKFATV